MKDLIVTEYFYTVEEVDLTRPTSSSTTAKTCLCDFNSVYYALNVTLKGNQYNCAPHACSQQLSMLVLELLQSRNSLFTSSYFSINQQHHYKRVANMKLS